MAKMAIDPSKIFILSIKYPLGVKAVIFNSISTINKYENRFSNLLLMKLHLDLVIHDFLVDDSIHHHRTSISHNKKYNKNFKFIV